MKPRGVRNNNPGNIEQNGIRWLGMGAASKDEKRFVRFVSPVYGLRALMKVLLTYQRKHQLTTIEEIIGRWAPPVENDTGAYAKAVARRFAADVTNHVDLEKPHLLIKFAQAITVHENGRPPPETPENWYSDELYAQAARLALSQPANKKEPSK